MESDHLVVVAMIHTNPADAAHVGAFHGDVIEGLTGSVRAIEDNGQSYIMILIPYPKEMTDRPIHALKHGC